MVLAFPFWLEKGVYNMMALQQFEHQKVLELCCGDGLLHTILLYLADLVYACWFLIQNIGEK